MYACLCVAAVDQVVICCNFAIKVYCPSSFQGVLASGWKDDSMIQTDVWVSSVCTCIYAFLHVAVVD